MIGIKQIGLYQKAGKLPIIGTTVTDHYGNKTHYLPVYKDDEGDVNIGLPDIVITPRNDLSLEGAVDKGRREAAPYVGAIVGGAAASAFAPLVSSALANPYVNAAFTIDGVRNALSGNGVQKTYRLAKEGDYWGAAKSGVGDALDLWGGYNMFKKGYNIGRQFLLAGAKAGNNWARAKILSREMQNISTPKINTVTPTPLFYQRVNTVPEGTNFTFYRKPYMSDEAWDWAYNQALMKRNSNMLNELRSLHFQAMSNNDPKVFCHSTHARFNQFDKKFFGKTDEGYHGKGFYFSTTRRLEPDAYSFYKMVKGPNNEVPYANYGPNKYYVFLKGNRVYDIDEPERIFFNEPNTVGFVGKKNDKFSEVIVGQPQQVKSAKAMTFDDNGNLIPLSKRDNFNNPDMRY